MSGEKAVREKSVGKNEAALLMLLRKALFSEGISLADDVDWNAVLAEANVQKVLGIAIKAIPNAFPKETQAIWNRKDLQRLAYNIRYLCAQDQLHALLVGAGIPYAILKGCASAIQYKQPLSRSMGDIDFIVPVDRFRDTRILLEKNGYIYDHGEEGDRHIAFRKDGFCFELHHHFSHDLPVLDQIIYKSLNHIVTAEVDGHAFSMLPPLANGIVLLEHMRSHLRGAMGLRQMIDWIMFVNIYLDDAYWKNEFRNAARVCGLETLAITATRMGQMYLGVSEDISWCRDANDQLCDKLMESLLYSGNFGEKAGKGARVESSLQTFRQMGLFHTLQFRGERNWELLKKYPYLKPFAWIYQTFRYIKRGLKAKRGKKLWGDVKRSIERYELIRDLKL